MFPNETSTADSLICLRFGIFTFFSVQHVEPKQSDLPIWWPKFVGFGREMTSREFLGSGSQTGYKERLTLFR